LEQRIGEFVFATSTSVMLFEQLSEVCCGPLLIVFVFMRQRMKAFVDGDLGEFYDTAERYFKQYFNTKLEARASFDALRAVQLERRRQGRRSLISSKR